MKRSKMLNILSQLIYDNVHYDSHHYGKILDGLVEAGMTPPKEKWNKECCDYCGTTLPDKLSSMIGDAEFCGWRCASRWEQRK